MDERVKPLSCHPVSGEPGWEVLAGKRLRAYETKNKLRSQPQDGNDK